MKRLKKRILLIPAVFVILAALCVYLFFGAKQTDTDTDIQVGENGTRSLIVYFTRSGNITAEEAEDTDAVSSASMMANDGSTEFAAYKLQQVTGADMFEIRTARMYRSAFWGTAATSFLEELLDTRPALAAYPDSLEKYDVIYVGYPIWWFNAPMAVGSFLEHYNLTGKTVVPFCTAQDNGIDVSMEYIREVSQGADVSDGYRFTAGTTEEDIRNWLEKIGISVKESVQEEDRTPDGEEQAMVGERQEAAVPADITAGTQSQRGFLNDNTLHSSIGDIHYSSYIPESYDGSEPYALFITLPGWEGLHFQGVGANMVEDFGTESINYNDRMIVLSTQLDDWGEVSADHAITLTEYFLEHYNIDPDKVYLHGMSGGGETGSLVMGKRPDLYTAYLMTSSQWDGDLDTLAEAGTPVYMAIAENDSYYGSGSLKEAYEKLKTIYEKQGLSEEEINRLLVLDVKEDSYFMERGFRDQHAGGQAFAHDETVMGWLFGEH